MFWFHYSKKKIEEERRRVEIAAAEAKAKALRARQEYPVFQGFLLQVMFCQHVGRIKRV